MYLHLGQDIVIKKSDIIGIFDIENTSVKKDTKEFLKNSQLKNNIINVSMDLPKSFCVCYNKIKKQTIVYITQMSVSTLQKRSELNKF